MKILTLTLALFLSLLCNAQITTTKVAEPPAKKYDSTENTLEDHVEQFIGQDLYLKGQSQGLREFGYDKFVIDYTKSEFDKDNIYKANDNGINSKYDSLAGKYFTVIDVIKDASTTGQYFLKLQEKEKKDIVYYRYETEFASLFPFITTGYFVKCKQMIAGKKFVVRGKNWVGGDKKPMLDMKTGLPVSDFQPGGVWTAIDLTVEEKYYTLSLILENAKHEQIPLEIDDLKRHFWSFEYEKANEYKSKFGAANWQLVLEGKVQKGMTDEMCELSWGKPKDVLKTTASDGKPLELWSYEDNKLYFSGGVLFEMQ
jgi:hypothetical protein